MSLPVDSGLLEQFNAAVALARQGRYQDALDGCTRLMDPVDRGMKHVPIVSGEFLGSVYMRMAYCLMDLDRYEDALAAFRQVRLFLSQFEDDRLFDFFYSLGNTLGNLGRIDEMDRAFSKALSIASEELGDEQRCAVTWHFLMHHAAEHGAWPYLAKEALHCMQFAQNHGLDSLKAKAAGRYAEAIRGAKAA